MGFNCGIVGLPNVGKSTLFNALTETAAAEAANYPFTTIEPNTGRAAVPDPRLDEIGRITKSAKIVPTFLEFVDIAGLVRGASKGEGLGNQFLGNIREVDAIVHVLRCFKGEATHVEGSIDPVRDADIVDTELRLADIESLERRAESLRKRVRGDPEARAEMALIEHALILHRSGRSEVDLLTQDLIDSYVRRTQSTGGEQRSASRPEMPYEAAQLLVEATRQIASNLVGEAVGGGRSDAFVVVHAVDQPRADVLLEEEGVAQKILEDDTDALAQRFDIPVGQWQSVEHNAPFGRLVQPRQQFNQGGLSRAVFADQRQAFTGSNLQADVRQRPVASSGVGKRHVFKFQPT